MREGGPPERRREGILKKTLGCFGVGFVALCGALAFFFTRTELGQWTAALVLITGGTIVAADRMYEVRQREVISVERTAKPDAFISARVQLAYVDERGERRTAMKQVVHRPRALESLNPRESVRIMVCRSDPSIVKIPSLPTFEPRKCASPSGD